MELIDWWLRHSFLIVSGVLCVILILLGKKNRSVVGKTSRQLIDGSSGTWISRTSHALVIVAMTISLIVALVRLVMTWFPGAK